MRQFFLSENSIDGNVANIEGNDVHHIKNVLRLKVKDHIKLIVPNGQSYHARIESITNKQICTRIVQSDQKVIQPKTHVTIAQSMLKDKKMDQLIRQATELGVSRWISYESERSVSRPNANRMTQKIQRWKKIAQSAAQQCSGQIPEICDQRLNINEMLALRTENQLGFFFWERSDNNFAPPTNCSETTSIFLVFGPEGGFSENEAACAKNAGFIISSLGPRILRAETATIAGLALIQYFFKNLALN